ncbi:hypothetical protein RND71_032219 [Anisodus tanguticus]|uniref:SWIM-type domain-containing protein n=1 Tax=Anisodus tanguticus TaxID=243964 RepID=A0AAE1V5M7_9SOLA|nr:hypothetical protein RND71_032219 [Anisodus tanguticus]
MERVNEGDNHSPESDLALVDVDLQMVDAGIIASTSHNNSNEGGNHSGESVLSIGDLDFVQPIEGISNNGVIVYSVRDRSIRSDFSSNPFMFKVKYKDDAIDGQKFDCQCRLFQSLGIPCRHMMTRIVSADDHVRDPHVIRRLGCPRALVNRPYHDRGMTRQAGGGGTTG